MKITNKSTDEEIKKYFADIAKTFAAKKPHQQVKTMKTVDEKFGDKVIKSEIVTKTSTLGKQVSTISENDKILKEVSNQINLIKNLKNAEAKKFYMTFYTASGEVDPKKKSSNMVLKSD